MLENIKNFLKKSWGYLIVICCAALGLILYKKKVDSYENVVQKMQGFHQKELDEIKEARENERKKYEENERKYKERIQVVENEYESAKIAFDIKKKIAVEKIVRTYGNKPDQLAQKLAEVTGFKIIMPED